MASWKQNPAIAVVAAVILVGAIILGVIMAGGQKVNYSLKCESCNNEFQAKLAKEAAFPAACPKCGKNTAYETVQIRCRACGKTFARINNPKAAVAAEAGNMAEKATRIQAGADAAGRCPLCGAQGQLEKVQ